MPTDTTPKAPNPPHGRVAKILHWSTAGLLVFAYIENGDVTNALRDPAAMRLEAALGIFIAAIFALRFFWMQRFNAGASRLPASAPWWEHRLSRLAHHSLYLGVMAIVATGLMIAAAQAWSTPQMVNITRDIHEGAANLTLFLIAAHVAAALWHKLMRQDGIWESMSTPWWEPNSGWLPKRLSDTFGLRDKFGPK